MIIKCPECGFSQNVNPDRIAESVIATCPKCQCRFRFSKKNGAENILPPAGWKNMDKESPEEEDIRQIASRAYEREAHRLEKDTQEEQTKARDAGAREPVCQNPWGCAAQNWFSAFYQTVLKIMFSAQVFFSSLNPDKGARRALIFYLLISVFKVATQWLWGSLFRSFFEEYASSDPQMAQLVELLTPETDFLFTLLISCMIMVVQLYVCAWAVAFMYKILGVEKASFNLIFQIIAYSAAPALLSIVPLLGAIAGAIWSLACLVIGCQTALKIGLGKTLAGFLPVALYYLFIFTRIGDML